MTLDPQMSLVSSRFTVFAKRVFPWLWFSLLGLCLLFVIASILAKQNTPIALLFVPTILAAFSYGIMRVFVWNLLDEVYDCEEYLLVRNNNVEDIVYFSNILELTHFLMRNPPSVTLTLKKKCKFGTEISFIPKSRIIRFLPNPTVHALRERIALADKEPIS